MSRWTRRRFVGSLPFAAASLATGSLAAGSLACRPTPSTLGTLPNTLTGSIVGASSQRGHRLRNGDLPTNPEVRGEVPLVILGAGIAGLSAGWSLRRAGFDDFQILELEDQPGGHSSWGSNAASAYPWGAHYLPQPTDDAVEVRELLVEMGLAHVDDAGQLHCDPRHLCHDPHERLYRAGGWQEGVAPAVALDPEALRQLEAFGQEMHRLASLRGEDGRRAFTIPLERSSQEPSLLALDRQSMAELLERRGWTHETLRWWVEYCCRDDYGSGLGETSAWAGCHYFASRPDDGAVLTWPEGNGRLVQYFSDRVGERLRLGQVVYRVEADLDAPDQGAMIDVLDAASDTAYRVHARRVIYALPRFLAPYLLAGVPRERTLPGPERWTYSPWVVANLTLPRLPRERDGSVPPHSTWDNVDMRSRSLGYVVATHQGLRSTPGPTVLTWYQPLSDSDPASARRSVETRDWESWAVEILDDLEGVHPWIREEAQHLDVMVWGHAMIRPIPGFLWGEARRLAAEPVGPIHFAHSDLSGISIFEEAHFWGVRAAGQVLEALA